MRVHFTNAALQHLFGIHQYIAPNSPRYAQQTIDRLTKRAEQIGTFPLSGAKAPENEDDEVREVIERPYRIIYRVKPDQVDILAVIHAARELPPLS